MIKQTRMPNKVTGANSRPASQFQSQGLRRCVLVADSRERYHGGASVAQFGRWTAPSTAQALRTRMRIGGWIWMKIKTAIFLVGYTAVFALLGW